ncbi:hypothetical protein [Natrarchaeobaculum sulfurireducens]|uniref:DUF3168 domain-containing protein n=1 Tax=Natrarchaeobaculum sulfurireducens TaxID=2044521 RepID=A0A346PMP2_9EURY|nr:hypothetical protein [Natrarchaeobaculum sulfurireducens]AXR80787.1 hypothetical protein AArcMg_0765 [Natrarchaeobaculum sulfurireducens]
MTRDDQLLVDAMGWLADDPDVAQYLESAEIGTDIIMAGNAAEADASPRVFVGVSEDSSERQNTREDKEFTVRVGVYATNAWVNGEGEDRNLLTLTRLKARIKDVLTSHRDGWGSTGLQSDDEIAPIDNPDGYLGVLEVGYERDDVHVSYD